MAEQKPPADPALELSTLSEGLPITIDGIRYEVAHPDSLSLGAVRRIERHLPLIGAMLHLENPTAAQELDLSLRLEQVCASILPDVPEQVRAKLSDAQRLAVVQVFLPLRPKAWRRPAGAAQSAPTRGEKRFLDWLTSMVGRLKAGTSESPSAS